MTDLLLALCAGLIYAGLAYAKRMQSTIPATAEDWIVQIKAFPDDSALFVGFYPVGWLYREGSKCSALPINPAGLKELLALNPVTNLGTDDTAGDWCFWLRDDALLTLDGAFPHDGRYGFNHFISNRIGSKRTTIKPLTFIPGRYRELLEKHINL